MADETGLESRPSQISKDVQPSENPIPLSPQWLLSKSGEIKSGLTVENHFSPHAGYSSRPDVLKSPGIGEEARENSKRKDVFRPSVLDMDSARRDCWRDEERDTNPAVRRGRWRDGEKEPSDNHRTDRWTDSSGKHYGEARRCPTDWWTDSGNREGSNDQRRESKWNTRWGPDDKEIDSAREKWVETSKDPDLLLDKSSSHVSYHIKDEKDGDHHRPWRLNSSQSRGREDPSPHHSSTPNRQGPVFAHVQGRGESSSTFSLGGGRVNSTSIASAQLQSAGSLSEKGETAHGESLPWRYSRSRLLDVYRTTDRRSPEKFLNELLQVPSLTQEDAIEPLAFFPHSPEELMILKGIDKGDVVSSGSPQVTRDGSTGRNLSDSLQSRRNKLGGGDDLPPDANESKEKALEGGPNYSEHSSREQQVHSYGFHTKVESIQDYHKLPDYKSYEASREEGTSYRKNDDVPLSRDVSTQSLTSSLQGGNWRSSSFGKHLHSVSHDCREFPGSVSTRATDVGWSDSEKDLKNDWGKCQTDQSYARLEGSKWLIGDDPVLRKQPSAILEKEQELHQVLQSAPEDLVLCYKDPQGEIQGPFGGSDIIGWFEAGYFGIDLLVCLAGAPPASPFCTLGDVMPHLRTKARPPPGFGVAKLNEMTDASSRFTFSSFGPVRAGSSEIDMIKNEPRYKHDSATEAENRFLESMMSGNISVKAFEKAVPSDGMRGYLGSASNPTPPLGAESADNAYLLAQKMTLERQRSLSNPYQWPGRDASSHFPTPDVDQDSSLPHSRLSSFGDNARPLQPSQNVDLLSILQGLPERSSAAVNKGASGWSKFSTQVGDPLNDKLDFHQAQNYPLQAAYGIQQQRLQPHTNMLGGQVMDNTSSMFGPEKLLSPVLSQDPQLLSLLQQHHTQQSQPPVALQQLNLLDKLLLLKQQQKQEQQQLLLQQSLSQVRSEHNLHQRFGESSYGLLQTAGFSAGHVPNDNSRFQGSHELFKMGSQIKIPSLQVERVSNLVVSPGFSHDVNLNVGGETSNLLLPHQLLGNAIHQSTWNHALSEPIDRPEPKASFMATSMTDLLPQVGITNNYPLEQSPQIDKSHLLPQLGITSNYPLEQSRQIDNSDFGLTSEAAQSFPSGEQLEQSKALSPVTIESAEKDPSNSGQVEEFGIPSAGALKEQKVEGNQKINESSSVREVKNVASRDNKKSSDKKSKKQRSAKAQSSDLAKGTKMQELRLAENEGTNLPTTSDRQALPEDLPVVSASPEIEHFKSDKMTANIMHVQEGQNEFPSISKYDSATLDEMDQPELVGSKSQLNNMTGQRAWKPAPGFKPKSLLEIQQEEQSRSETDTAVSVVAASLSSSSASTPWAGVVANLNYKTSKEAKIDVLSADSSIGMPDSSANQKNRKIQLHDLLQDISVAKPHERERENPGIFLRDSIMSSLGDSVEDNTFIGAIDTKKSRKKSAKGKGAGSKVSIPSVISDVSLRLSSSEKGKNTRTVQQGKELLPVIPSGPSLGDFVVWKGESTNSVPLPAWSTDSGKLPKPTSLRDIQKEQGRKGTSQHIPVPSPQKSGQSQSSCAGGSSRSASASSPAKAASPIQTNAQVSLAKHKADDDLFWGPVDQLKQETISSDFPQLGSSWGTKITPLKANPAVVLGHQKSTGGRSMDQPPPSNVSPYLSVKGKKDSSTKHSEAMDFREWCENECVRLIGTKDTSFLEYCLKQSRQEAETLLVEKLGSFDPNHEFIEKFLNFKDLLPADVLEIAFESWDDRRIAGSGAGEAIFDNGGFRGFDANLPKTCLGQSDVRIVSGLDESSATAPEGSAKVAGGKKAKKGKKVSPSALGFNVVSNRIMMGEIQSVED